jgi:hypothetical protein
MKTLQVIKLICFIPRYLPMTIDVQVGAWKHGNREITGKRKIKSSTMGKLKQETK